MRQSLVHPTHALKTALLAVFFVLQACASKLPTDQRGPLPDMPSAQPPAIDIDLGTGTPGKPAVATDLFALLGVQPNHGAFSGGQLAILRGNGFTPSARVWFGAAELSPANVQPVDSKRLQIIIPEGTPGSVDVTTQNGEDSASRRTLLGGYTFDSFFVAPELGPTAGGSEVHVHGRGTQWDDKSQVFVDLKPCELVRVLGPEELICVTPPGSSGSKAVRVATSDGVQVDVADGYTYSDTTNNFRGGLSGNALSGKLDVFVFDRNLGKPIVGAIVVTNNGTSIQTVDATGRLRLEGSEFNTKQTLTVAATCYQPMTFVDVPVETATIYLDPVLSPACGAAAETRLTGGASLFTESVEGELIWPSVREFERGGWGNVPAPKSPDEQYAAYVFPLSSDPSAAFVLPATYDAVTQTDFTNSGYRFSLRSYPDTLTLYALAGVENRAVKPPFFIPYVMGIVPGVKVEPERTKGEVFLAMNIQLDQTLKLQVAGPELTPRGPNRLLANVAVGWADQGYIILPGGQKQTLYPAIDGLNFVGLPPLIDRLSGTSYVASATTYTGDTGGVPRSRGTLVKTSLAGQLLVLDQFVEIPKLVSPGENVAWDGRLLSVDWASGGVESDLVIVDISSAGGLINWTVVIPRGTKSVELPALGKISSGLGIAPGPLTLKLSSARIDDFNYGSLGYGDLSSRAWSAYAQDVLQSRLAP